MRAQFIGKREPLDGRGRSSFYVLPRAAPPRDAPIFNPPSAGEDAAGSELRKAGSEHFGLISEHWRKLVQHSAAVGGAKRVSRDLMESVILDLCSEQFLSIKALAELVNRSADTLRVHYISSMVKRGLLDLQFPDRLNHPNQGYRTHGEG
jgi:hypothetical protein